MHNNYIFGLRVRLFVVVALVIVSAQCWYAYSNVIDFQHRYQKTLEQKALRLGNHLRKDIEMVVGMNIPLSKLKQLEKSLATLLTAAPELQFAEVQDAKHSPLFRAEGTKTMRFTQETRPSKQPIQNFGIWQHIIDINRLTFTLPVTNPRSDTIVGNLVLQVSSAKLIQRAKRIILDMVTVILASLLLMFELLSFIAGHTVGHPLKALARRVEHSAATLQPLTDDYVSMPEMRQLIENFNDSLRNAPSALSEQQQKAQALLAEWCSAAQALSNKARQAGCDMLATASQSLSASLEQAGPLQRIPYGFIRPLVFFFLIADGFCISFLPLFVSSLYEPIAGLSREVVIGLPISLYFLALGITMPIAGKATDSIGWYKPLLTGIICNALGLLLTALAQDIWQLMAYRTISAVGFGVTFMACQQFVITNTDSRSRAPGLASFLAAFFSGDICGTVMGGMLAERIGYRNVFLASGSIALIAIVFALLIFRGDFKPRKSLGKLSLKFPFTDMLRVIRDADFAVIILLQAIPAKLTLIGFLYYFVPLYLASLDTTQSDIGRIIMIYGLLLVCLGPPFSAWLDRPKLRASYVAIGGILTGTSLLAFFFAKGIAPLLLAVTALGIAHTLSVSSQSSLISETAIVQRIGIGTGMGLFRLWERIGNVAGPCITGILIANFGFEMAAVYLGGISLTGSLLYGIIKVMRSSR